MVSGNSFINYLFDLIFKISVGLVLSLCRTVTDLVIGAMFQFFVLLLSREIWSSSNRLY
jgi:hypothetical protein